MSQRLIGRSGVPKGKVLRKLTAAAAASIFCDFAWCSWEFLPRDQFAVLPVRILRKAESTLVASKAEVSMKLRSFLRANSFASSISTALTDRDKLGAVADLLNW